MPEQHNAADSKANFRPKVIRRFPLPIAAAGFSAKDALYALASVAIITGFNIQGTDIPLFSIIVAAIVWVDRANIGTKIFPVFLLPPLLLFVFVHLALAFRGGMNNGVFYIAQFLILFPFVWLFVARYSSVYMGRFNLYFSTLLLALLAYVLWWHISRGVYVSWKLLTDPKAVFSLLPLMLVLMTRSQSLLLRRLTPVLLVAFAAIIFLSGERKAYFLLLMFLPLMFNMKNPATYLIPIVLLSVVPIAASLDPTGYLNRQLSTVEGFAQGRVVKTVSNEGRSDALRVSFQIIREHPIFGVGTNRQLFAAYELNSTAPAAHNEWVRVAAENGVVGLFFYVCTALWGLFGVFRTYVLGRYRSRAEKEAALALVVVLLMYISFEAFDFIVLLAFLLIPFVQYLRLTAPSPAPAGVRLDQRRLIRRPVLRPASR